MGRVDGGRHLVVARAPPSSLSAHNPVSLSHNFETNVHIPIESSPNCVLSQSRRKDKALLGKPSSIAARALF